MISFILNGRRIEYVGREETSLLTVLREEAGIISTKDGCSGQGACGACMVELDGRPALSCSIPIIKVSGREVITLDGFPENVRDTLAQAFVAKGAVQCGFCTPGMLARAKILLENSPSPSREDIVRALSVNLCRCTGYAKIIEAILFAAESLREKKEISGENRTGIGFSSPKYFAYEKAIGSSPFISDMQFEGMLYGALKFSEHPRARLLVIDASEARKMPGVVKVFDARDIPGKRYQGLIRDDWPMMIDIGEETRYIGDVIAAVVADTEYTARLAVNAIKVEYDVLQPITDPDEAAKDLVRLHPDGNLLKETTIHRGESVDDVMSRSAHVVEGIFHTPFVEHAFLETEAAIALPDGEGGITLYSQGQGIFRDREQVASVLGVPEQRVKVIQVSSGGAFGGKEDLSVQHHAALFSWLLQEPVQVKLSRPDSIRMHPKKHRMVLEYALACDENGILTALRARITGDSGAYASVGGEVVARTGTHAAGAYHIPSVDVVARAYYTNNPPAGAFRGFGVNQATFAVESLIDELCDKGGFDRWQFRYDNAQTSGKMTTTGHILGKGVGLHDCLIALREDFYKYEFAGLACAIKNSGIGNGVTEVSETRLKVIAPDHIEIQHGWTEMGQGIHTIARQVLCEVLKLDKSVKVSVRCATETEIAAGVTTASRGTWLLGNSVIDAAKKLAFDLECQSLNSLVGKQYLGRYTVDWTTRHDVEGEIKSHFSYAWAAHLAILNSDGSVKAIYAAHDAGKIINPALFEGQIEGGVVMGIGYALSEKLPLENCCLVSDRMSKLGLLRAGDVPEIRVFGIESEDPAGPFGAKGIGEIATIPTAPALANAYTRYDGKRRYQLPLVPPMKKDKAPGEMQGLERT
jgi:aldehyde oxidoreductase